VLLGVALVLTPVRERAFVSRQLYTACGVYRISHLNPHAGGRARACVHLEVRAVMNWKAAGLPPLGVHYHKWQQRRRRIKTSCVVVSARWRRTGSSPPCRRRPLTLRRRTFTAKMEGMCVRYSQQQHLLAALYFNETCFLLPLNSQRWNMTEFHVNLF
jgi:hypothetical protein